MELTEPLMHGIRYLVSFYASPGERYSRYAISTLGAALTITPPQTISEHGLLDAEPQVLSQPLVPLMDTANWVLISDTVLPRFGGERYLTIGNFHPDSESDTVFFNSGAVLGVSYYYIDDVSVIALDSIPDSVEEIGRTELFKVYPNPSNGLMTVGYSLTEGESGTLSIYSTLGGLVFQRPLDGGADRMDIDVMHLRSGIYLLTIQVNGRIRLAERISIVNE